MGKQQILELTECAKPASLLYAWRNKDLKSFKTALDEGSDPNHVFEDDGFRPILGIIASEPQPEGKEFAEILLSTAVNKDKQYLSGNCAIHLAAEVANLGVIQALVAANADVNVLNQTGSTALHVLVKQKWKKGDDSYRKCVEFISTQENTELNVRNSSGYTPIHFAARFKNKDAIVALLERGTLLDLDSNTVGSDCLSARDAITKLYPELEQDLPPKLRTESIKMDSSKLFSLLYHGEEDRFCEAFKKEMLDKSQRYLLTCNNGKQTLLQYACDNNMQKVVEVLLSNGADLNLGANESPPPVQIAGKRGYYEILKMLLNEGVNLLPDHRDETALHCVARYCKNSPAHSQCLTLLLEKVKEGCLNINVQDVEGNTALHYAVKFADDWAIIELLKHGAYIGVKNMKNETPLFRMSHQVLNEFLDGSLQEEGTQQFAEEYAIVFDYRFLIPPVRLNYNEESIRLTNENDFAAVQSKDYYSTFAETEPLLIMSKKKDLHRLLNHPVLTSFTFLKWQRIQSFFYINLAFYIAFCILLTGYILFGYRQQLSVEAHPTNSLLDAVPDKIGLHDKSNYSKPSQDSYTSDSSVLILIIRIIILCFVAVLCLRELFQLAINPKAYLFNPENWLEVALIAITTSLVVRDCVQVTPSDTEAVYICPQLCALAVLLSCIELVLLIGKHPKYSVQVEMFQKVTISFVRFLSWYILLIIAFALSFFVLFRGCSGECEESNPFTNPGTSLFKTIVMLTGEFESGEIPFRTYVGTSHVIFTAFVFLIAIVLLNLLNGLAVADTKIIHDESYLYTCIARVRLISFFEEILSGNAAKFLHILSCCFFFKPTKLKCLIFDHFARNIAFFPSLIPEGIIRVSPNLENRIEFVGRKQNSGECHGNRCISKHFIDQESMSEARRIIAGKKADLIERNKNDLARSLENCTEQLNQLTSRVGDIEKRFESIEHSNKQIEQLLIQNIAISSYQVNNEERR